MIPAVGGRSRMIPSRAVQRAAGRRRDLAAFLRWASTTPACCTTMVAPEVEVTPSVKPLFDSEHFAFIGDSEDRILVHCRKCGRQAGVEVELQGGHAVLSATCESCGNQRMFTVAKLGKAASASGSGASAVRSIRRTNRRLGDS